LELLRSAKVMNFLSAQLSLFEGVLVAEIIVAISEQGG
jgi:hypothetical protein